MIAMVLDEMRSSASSGSRSPPPARISATVGTASPLRLARPAPRRFGVKVAALCRNFDACSLVGVAGRSGLEQHPQAAGGDREADGAHDAEVEHVEEHGPGELA